MRVSYNKLWKLLIDKRMSKSELRDAVNMRICKELKCDIGDIIEILPDDETGMEAQS